MKQKFRNAYRTRRILASLGIYRVQWNDAMQVIAYESLSTRQYAEFLNFHKSIRTQYSWF